MHPAEIKTTRVTLLGGPHHGRRADLRGTPERITVGPAAGNRETYEQLLDPDDGSWLGAYVWQEPDSKIDVWSKGSAPSMDCHLGRLV